MFGVGRWGAALASCVCLTVACGGSTEGASREQASDPRASQPEDSREPGDRDAGNGGSSGSAGAEGNAASGGSAAAGGAGGNAGQEGSDPEASGGGQGNDGGAGGEGGLDTACPSPSPLAAPLRRLSGFEYQNTLHALFGDASAPPDPFLIDYDLPVESTQIETYHARAHELASSLSQDPAALDVWLGCSVTDEGEDLCRARLFEEVLPRVLRRPLNSEDVDDFQAVFEQGEELGGGFESGVRAVLEVALQSPEFLYFLEFGEPAPERGEAWSRLTGYELASRLSYLYWGSPPDAELLAAAEQGELSTPDEVATQATRLLDHERARNVVRHFYARLFDLRIPSLASSGEYPGFNEEISALMLQETAQFVDSVTWDPPGDFRTLLTASHSFVNGPLAEFYGNGEISGEDFERAEFEPARRAGLLTQPSVLVMSSNSLFTSPTFRGYAISTKLLCLDIPEKPAELAPLVPSEADPAQTTRERYAIHSQSPACATCHSQIDPIGFAFGNYDAAGRWQDTENGQAIDASGEIFMTDAAGTFVGPRELAERLAESDDARRCYVQDWMAFAYRRGDAEQDACTQSLLNDAFLSSDGNVRELLLALSRTEAFLYRPTREVAQ